MKTYVFSDAHNCDHTYVRLADHDAALRRAKAEVLRELTQSLTYTRFNSYEQGMCERGCGLTKEGKIGASIGLAWALGEIDARAAQIEEGE